MNQIIKLGVGIMLAGLLTACGPDGDSGGEEGILSKGGECVNIGPTSSKKGSSSTERIRAFGKETFVETKVLEYNSKVIKASKRYYGAEELMLYVEAKYEIKNNYSYDTETNLTTIMQGMETKVNTSSNPHGIRVPYGKVCKGQSWVDVFTSNIVTYPGEKESNQTFNSIWGIEDINVEKTVEAGEFSTYIKVQYADKEKKKIKLKEWVDMKSGLNVYSETYRNGQVERIHELIEFDQ